MEERAVVARAHHVSGVHQEGSTRHGAAAKRVGGDRGAWREAWLPDMLDV